MTPLRPLGQAGLEFWERAWDTRRWDAADAELLQIACEQLDERVALRVRVLRDNVGEERKALRDLDRLIVTNLTALGFFRGTTFTSEPLKVAPEGW